MSNKIMATDDDTETLLLLDPDLKMIESQDVSSFKSASIFQQILQRLQGETLHPSAPPFQTALKAFFVAEAAP